MIEKFRRIGSAMAVLSVALGLAACQTDGNKPVASAAIAPAPGGQASAQALAFESIDGPPQPVFNKLVGSLSSEAGAQRIPVASRQSDAPYRVRGYLAAVVEDGKGSIDWAWDVYDGDRDRVLRVSGVEPVGSGDDVWNNVDQATLDRIAAQSLQEISTRLAQLPADATSPTHGKPAAAPASVEEPLEEPAGAPAIRTDDGPPIASADTVPTPALALASHL